MHHFLAGVSLESPQPGLLFWSDALDQGWEANLLNQFVSGRWSQVEREFSINLRELCIICLGLLHFHHSLLGQSVGVFSNNTTALSYGGTFLAALNHKAQLLLRWAESLGITLVPQFIMGVTECRGGFPELSRPGYRFRVNPSSGGGRRIEDEVASDDRPLFHLPQLLSSHLLLPPERPHGGRDRCIPSVLEQSPGVCLSPFALI